ncbi:hypothetical protein KAF25_000325, partial [Fusarium avenaceum]
PDHPFNEVSYLNAAAILRRDESFRIIADTGKVDITAKDPQDDGMTSLHRAYISGCVETIEFLLQHDSVRVTVNKRDENGRNSRFHGVEKGQEKISQRLVNLNTVNRDAVDNQVHTPFNYAINHGHQDITRALLNTGRVNRQNAARMSTPQDEGISGLRKSLDISETKAEINADELRLAQMGHTQELNRHFSTLSLIGLASTTTISWTGLGLGLITEIGAGGPGAVIYGFILVTILQCFLGASLAEFVSSYPTEGGMYHWIAAVAPRRSTGILSFLTGWFSVLGWIFTTASTNIIYAQILMALIALYKADLEIQAWQTFIVYQGLNLLTAGVVMFGNKIIPALNKFSLFYLQIGWLVVLVTVVACAPTHRDPEFVFRTWINTTGWQNNGITFITGLVNPLYSLGGLDGVTHITEEMPNPSRNAPMAIAITLIIAFCTGLTYLISLMFSIQDFDQLTTGNTGMPLAELFRQVTQKTGGAFGLLFILWSKVHSTLKIPFNSQLVVTAVIAALGCLYLGSSTAFNSLLGTAVTINNISYMFPILTNLLTGRKNMHKGAFHMGPTIGTIVNIVTVCWLTFAIVFFSFPYVMPVEVANMNYTCVVVGGLTILIGAWWLKAGKEYTERMMKAKEA